MLLLVRYGEIGLKSAQVRAKFEQRLRDNLAARLTASGIDGDIVERDDRIFVDVEPDDAADAALALSQVPGVESVSPVETAALEMDAMGDAALTVVAGTDGETFAVDARRAGDHAFTSDDIEAALGDRIRAETDMAVDLDDPDVTVNIEARYTTAYLYSRTVDGVGGLPVADDARVAVLMTDRAATVAAARLMTRGCTVYPVYTGHEPDALEPEMELLRQFDPGVKLTTLQDEDPAAALVTVADLYDCTAVAHPATTAELADAALEVDRPVLYPNCGRTEAAVLDEYAALMPAPVTP